VTRTEPSGQETDERPDGPTADDAGGRGATADGVGRTRAGSRALIARWWQPVAFLLVFLTGGAAFLAVTPPGLNPDEPAHVLRAWQVAHGGLVADEASGIEGISDGDPGGYVPTAWRELFDEAHFTRGFEDAPTFRDLDREALAAVTDDGDREWQTFTNTVQYPPVAYVPQVVALWIGDGLGLGALDQLLLGRALGLVAVAGLLLGAARLAPVGRLVFYAVGLLPSVVAQAASFSADGVTIGLCVLATALVLRWSLREGSPGWWRWVLLGALFVAIALVKPTYAPLAVIVALVPLLNPAARRVRSLASAAGVVALAAGVTLAWLRLTSWVTQGVNPNNDPAAQREYLLSDPFVFVKATVRSLFLDYPTGLTTEKGEIWRGVFGSFAWLRAPLPMAFVVLLCVALVLAVLVVEPREERALEVLRGGVLWRVVVLAGIGAVVGAVCLALYIYYTETEGQWLQGLQGRYFLPVLPALLLLFVGGRLVSTRGVRVFVFGAAAASLVAALVTVDLHFYQSVLPYWG